MDFCSNCGATTDPDWVFCRACGRGLDVPESDPGSQPPVEIENGAPKVELISRGWDVIEIDDETQPPDPLDTDVIDVPLPPGAVEVAVDEITVVAAPPPTEASPPEGGTSNVAPLPDPGDDQPADGWDHLRPHGEIPPLLRRSKAPSRVGQLTLLLFALSAVAGASTHLYANIQLDAFGNGDTTARSISDAREAADISLIVVASLGVLALAAVLWWFVTRDKTARWRLRISGVVGILALIAGASLVATFRAMEQKTVAEALTANTLITIGLGLLMVAGLAGVRSLGHAEHATR